MNGQMMTPTIWKSLVVETQFATELTLTGLRRLCSVPTDPVFARWGSDNLNYALHVGMYSYSSGLERLCKLAIACNSYAVTGEFPRLRDYNHRIGNLLNAVGELPLPPSGPGVPSLKMKYLAKPSDSLDPDLTNTLERFANGAGRYEHLDSLWKDDTEVNTYKEWSALAQRASVPESVSRLVSTKERMAYAIESELFDAGLPATSQRVIQDLALPTYEPSVGVVLSLFRKARWVSTNLDVATFYTGQDLPILGEVFSRYFLHTSTNFFEYHIAGIGDEYVVGEELQEMYGRIRAREALSDNNGFEEVEFDE